MLSLLVFTLQAPSQSPSLLEALGTLGLSFVVALPGELPVKDLEAAVCKQTWHKTTKSLTRQSFAQVCVMFDEKKKCAPVSPSGRGTLIFNTDIRLFTSLLMLSATPGYCKGDSPSTQVSQS